MLWVEAEVIFADIPCQKPKYQRTCDILIYMENQPNSIYVDGTPTPAKIQISHFLKVGQFYIDVYSICNK